MPKILLASQSSPGSLQSHDTVGLLNVKNKSKYRYVTCMYMHKSGKIIILKIYIKTVETYFPSFVGWFIIRVFITSDGVPMRAATKPEQTL